jgi:hypothetical protein
MSFQSPQRNRHQEICLEHQLSTHGSFSYSSIQAQHHGFGVLDEGLPKDFSWCPLEGEFHRIRVFDGPIVQVAHRLAFRVGTSGRCSEVNRPDATSACTVRQERIAPRRLASTSVLITWLLFSSRVYVRGIPISANLLSTNNRVPEFASRTSTTHYRSER